MILAELRRVLITKFKVPSDRVAAIEAIFAPFPLLPKPAGPSELEIRDSADRWILATAIAGAADVLVTGDDDLLAVAIPCFAPSLGGLVLAQGGSSCFS